MQYKNVLIILIDNLRYDSFSIKHGINQGLLFPNISKLISKGFNKKLITNGHVTKFSMPSLFTQTYPFDYGGYNDVIAKRPKSFIELFAERKYKTFMFQGDDNDGPISGCERGFTNIESIYDLRLHLQNYLEEVLEYEIQLCKKNGLHSDEAIIEILNTKFKNLLEFLASGKNRVSRYNLPGELKKPTRRWKYLLNKEIELLEKEPLIIADKILNIPPNYYYTCLGKNAIGGFQYLFMRIKFAIISRIIKILKTLNIFPFRVLTCRRAVLASELLLGIKRVIRKIDEPWLVYAHIMDLHDRRLINRPIFFIKKLLFWFKWKKLTKNKFDFVKFQYDAALYTIDKEIGNIIYELKKKNIIDETMIVITSDHGCERDDAKNRGINEEFGFRTHPEHIEIPLVLSPIMKEPKDKGLYDTMSISATILDEFNINQHPSFKGNSVFNKGKYAVITENAGRGNGDIKRKNLYFTVTSSKYKLMALLKKNNLFIKRFYDTKIDPLELNNCINDAKYKNNIIELLEYLFCERKEILKSRGVDKNRVLYM